MGHVTDDPERSRPYGLSMALRQDDNEKERTMVTTQQGTDRRRFRLATNANETVSADVADRRRFRLAGNDNETVSADDTPDTEGHRLAGNDNETIVEAARRLTPEPDGGESFDELPALRR
jgi:hypothetical protein